VVSNALEGHPCHWPRMPRIPPIPSGPLRRDMGMICMHAASSGEWGVVFEILQQGSGLS
jgi:hypothetical protein